MKDVKRLSVLFFLILLGFVGCSNQSAADTHVMDKKFALLIPITDMNKSLKIDVYGDESTFHFDSDIPLIVSNKSSHSIYFDVNSHIRLLINSGGQWKDIQNAFTYSGTMLLSPEGTPLLDLQYTDVQPMPNENNPNINNSDVLLRIVIIGEIMDGNARTGENAAAYVDVVLKP